MHKAKTCTTTVYTYIRTVSSYVMVHLFPCRLFWCRNQVYGGALPKWPINLNYLVLRSIKQVIRAYCPNTYTVCTSLNSTVLFAKNECAR